MFHLAVELLQARQFGLFALNDSLEADGQLLLDVEQIGEMATRGEILSVQKHSGVSEHDDLDVEKTC